MKIIKKIVVAIFSFTLLVACQTNVSSHEQLMGSITAVGSSALQPLVEYAAELFQKEHTEVMINVQGGGSGQGLSQIIAGTVEIGNSDVFAEEKKVKVSDYAIMDHKVAVVGIAPIVNFSANVTNVTQQQLIDIFTGKLSNWSQLGGTDLPIVVINRASGSGSRATFEQYGLLGADPITAQEQDNSGTVKKLVAETKGAISYVSFSYLTDDYQALSVDGVAPTRQNVETNAWKIWAYEHMYTATDKDPITQKFIDFILSESFQQEVVPQLGYIPVHSMTIDRDLKGVITPK